MCANHIVLAIFRHIVHFVVMIKNNYVCEIMLYKKLFMIDQMNKNLYYFVGIQVFNLVP